MSGSSRGDAYRSFQYLEPGRDYRLFQLADQVGRVEPYRVPLSEAEEDRVARLIDSSVVLSLHEHTGVFPADIRETPEYVRHGRMATAFEGLKASCLDAVFDNLMDGICTIRSRTGWQWDDVLHDLGMRLCDLAHQDYVIPCRRLEDIFSAHEQDRVAWVASMEGAAMIENDLDRIDLLYGFGVRSLGVTYSEANALGSGLKEPRDGGLTAFGRQAVERMNKVGMLVDCSHAGDRTTLDTIEVSDKPVVLSHIGAQALWGSNRLAPDRVLEACAEGGGVIGIEAAPHTTITHDIPRHGLRSFMEHFEYVVNLVGIDHVAFGPDTVYGDHVELHRLYVGDLSLDESREAAGEGVLSRPETEKGFPEVPYVKGLENPTEASHNCVRWLVKHGYSDEEIRKVVGGNVLRVLESVWA